MTLGISARYFETWVDCLLNHSIGGILPEDLVMIKGERMAWPVICVLGVSTARTEEDV